MRVIVGADQAQVEIDIVVIMIGEVAAEIEDVGAVHPMIQDRRQIIIDEDEIITTDIEIIGED